MVVYNARTQQKWLTILFCGGFEFLLLFAFFLGEIYKNPKETLVVVIIMVGVLLLGRITYLLLIKFANSVFIFDESGFVRKWNNRTVLQVKWEDVTAIGTYKIYDFFKLDIGPMFLGIDYYDVNHNQQSLSVAFSAKDAKRLKASRLNKKLDNIV